LARASGSTWSLLAAREWVGVICEETGPRVIDIARVDRVAELVEALAAAAERADQAFTASRADTTRQRGRRRLGHETGSRLLFRGAEIVGGYGHPGLSYAFDRFEIQRPGEAPFTKGSYDTSNGNHTAYQCFHDPIFLAAFGSLQPTGQAVRDREEWKHETWPVGVPTSIDASTAFIQEADFYKFRGRGAIQSTGRVAYLPIVDFVRAYTGADTRITTVKQRWETLATTLAGQGITLSSNDGFATVSTNADWDSLFSTVTIQAVAIRAHNAIPGKQYVPMSTTPAVLRGTQRGSAYFVAIAIAEAGNPSYASDVRTRMLEFIGTLWNTPMPSTSSTGTTNL
jgi:hypothetical protein